MRPGHAERSARAYDNPKAESFFKTLRVEQVCASDYATVEEVARNLGKGRSCRAARPPFIPH